VRRRAHHPRRRPAAAGTRALLALALLTLALPVLAADDAPAWRLPAAGGGEIDFRQQLEDGPVVVSFWALWCKPCLHEMPRLAELAERYAGRVSFVAVNTDDSKSVAKVGPYLQGRDWRELQVALDTGGDLQRQLQVDILPFLLVYDQAGREAYRHVGYKDGDEIELAQRLDEILAAGAPAPQSGGGDSPLAGVVSASDRFEYSYEDETRKEIVENWLDVSYRFGDFTTGLMLNSQAPGEEGGRRNEIRQRWFAIDRGDWSLRAGHFYGMFGRGLVFASYEDRTLRVDTSLDGVLGRVRHGSLEGAFFSGTPSDRDLDLRGGDLTWTLPGGAKLGVTGLTWQRDPDEDEAGRVTRDWVAAMRAQHSFGVGDVYVEYGERSLDVLPLPADEDRGSALYANLNLYRGPWALSVEASDYDEFEIIPNADGQGHALNRPPALARDFTWTLLNRAPHVLNARDEVGLNADLSWNGPDGLHVVASAADIERHDGGTVYQLAYLGVEKERWGDLRLQGAAGYQDSEGLRQTVAAEITWFAAPDRSWALQAEHQHVRLGSGGPGIELGAYDQQWFKLEYATAPDWSFAAILETNNKFDEQRAAREKPGPFPAAQISRTLSGGGSLSLWFGERQEGYLCSGGVCKVEPAFAGVEVTAIIRY
jgi:cytochrome c biogenesis protein CcmG/thiol:disulfide interchange protein DsbE